MKIGANTVSKVMIGSNEVSKIYVGSTLLPEYTDTGYAGTETDTDPFNDSSLQNRWLFNNDATDLLENSDATINGTEGDYTTGFLNEAYEITTPSTSDYIALNTGTPNSSFSISCFVNLQDNVTHGSSLADGNAICGSGADAATTFLLWWVEDDGAITFQVSSNSFVNRIVAEVTAVDSDIVNGTTHHIVAVYDTAGSVAANTRILIYVDGVLQTITNTENGTYTHQAHTAIRAGSFWWSKTDGEATFKGWVDQLDIYTKAISSTEVGEISFDESEEEVTYVSSIVALESAKTSASAGDIIELADGTYDGDISLGGSDGTEANPIIVRAATDGGVIFKGQLLLNSDWLTLQGFNATSVGSGYILFGDGLTGARITRCKFDDSQADVWLKTYTSLGNNKKITIDYNTFTNKTNNLTVTTDAVILKFQTDQVSADNHHVHHNYFYNIPVGLDGNGYEAIQFLTVGNVFNPTGGDTDNIVEYNLFDDAEPETELISIKVNGVTLRYNTFKNMNEAFYGIFLRHCHRATVEDNFFMSIKKGIAVLGTDHSIKRNYFYDSSYYSIDFANGDDDPTDYYMQVDNVTVDSNMFVDCATSAFRFNFNNMSTLAVINSTMTNNEVIAPTALNYNGLTTPTFTTSTGNVYKTALGETMSGWTLDSGLTITEPSGQITSADVGQGA